MHLAYFKVSSISFLKQLYVQSERKGTQETSAVSRVKLYQLSLLPVCDLPSHLMMNDDTFVL